MLEGAPRAVSGREAWAAVVRLAPRHRAYLWKGLGLTLFGVAAQLTIPWPLKELFKGSQHAAWRADLPDWLSASVAMSSLFLFLMLAAGFFDYVQRVAFARFAIGWSRDLRAAAHRAAGGLEGCAPELHRGDLVARLIGDVARFKASVKVTLVYVASNGLLLIAGCVVVWSIHASFGFVFMGALALAVLVGALGARRSFRDFAGYRETEGALATSLSGAGEMDSDDLELSGELEASEVRQQSGAAWAASAIVGAMVASILIIGGRGLQSGSIDADTLLLFLGYALFLSKPLVRLTRHGARVGKLVAGGLRLGSYLAAAESNSRDLLDGMPRADQRIDVALEGGRGWRLPTSGVVHVQQELLFEALLGREQAHFEWDGVQVTPLIQRAASRVVERRNLWSVPSIEQCLAGVEEFAPSLAALGVADLAATRSGLAVASGEVSRAESAGVALALAACEQVQVILLDRVDEVLDDEGLEGLRCWCEVAGKRGLVVVRTLDPSWLPAELSCASEVCA